jgi:MFS family permease
MSLHKKTDSDAYAVLKIREFVLFISARFFVTLGIQMQSVIVGWQVYEITKDPLSLGLIGLAEIIPFFGIALFGGHIADVFDRKRIILLSVFTYLGSAFMLFLLATRLSDFIALFGTLPIYGVIFFTGISRAFLYPAIMGLIAQIVPRELYANSSTWNSFAWQIAAVSGPAIGGIGYGYFGGGAAYAAVVAFILIGLTLYSRIKRRPVTEKQYKESVKESLKTGLKFVFNNQVIWGAMTLDMFAVLFGGVVALLPIFAAERLFVGPQGLGLLRAAPFIGAVIMSFAQAHFPPLKNAGRKLLISIAGFGICIIIFAFSKNFYLSMGLLILSGMFDNVSVVIRNTIVQLFTPDDMRGRVAAINSIFIGSSNELGSFESGVAAKLMGLIPSVVFGGSMTLFIAAFTAKKAPSLRRLNLMEKI